MKLFPPYLPPGSKGPAVLVLQLILKTTEHGGEIVVDGDYGPKTTEAVRHVQEDLGVEPDGHFGPATRKAMVESEGPDVNALERESFTGETTVPGTSPGQPESSEATAPVSAGGDTPAQDFEGCLTGNADLAVPPEHSRSDVTGEEY